MYISPPARCLSFQKRFYRTHKELFEINFVPFHRLICQPSHSFTMDHVDVSARLEELKLTQTNALPQFLRPFKLLKMFPFHGMHFEMGMFAFAGMHLRMVISNYKYQFWKYLANFWCCPHRTMQFKLIIK